MVYQMRLDGLRVAVKRLRAEQRGNPTFVAAFRKEYAIGRGLKHDSLPVYRELHADENEVYIVMDYVDGISLDDFIKTDEGQDYFRSAENVRRFLSELIGVVAYLHHAGIIHCDIKPANVMLRHSDRSVMLIDLDKSYSDTLDNTHGGTINSSDPLASGKRPTAGKDIAAIGKLIDVLVANVTGFPSKEFKKFRNACQADGMTADNLNRFLTAPSRSKWPLFVVGVGIITLILYVLVGNGRWNEPVISSENILIAKDSIVARDTVVRIIKEPSYPASATQEVKIDFDDNMSSFIQMVDDALARLSTGTLSSQDITDLLHSTVENYTNAYGNLVKESKARYSGVAGIDVEMAVAGASEQSRATQLLQCFTQAAADTISARNGDSD